MKETPLSPVVAVGAVILKNNKVLLIKRGEEPYKGFWSIPGGKVKFGERIKDALKREVKEETGLDIEIEKLIYILKMMVKNKKGEVLFDYLILDFLTRAIGGEIKASSDAAEIRWISLKKIDSYNLVPTERRMFEKLKKKLI